MKNFVETHLIQNFAPSLLNRDDTNSPKEAEFGGHRRARISSQCLKRAVRHHFKDAPIFPSEELAVRTKRVAEALKEKLMDLDKDRDAETALAVAETALGGMELIVSEGKTQYLLFLGLREVDALARVINDSWEVLPKATGEATDQDEEGQTGRDKKKAAKEKISKEIKGQLDAALDGGRAVDLALFGRMLADRPEKNIDAACQVAHALSTHAVSREFDFYTAVDDLRPEDTQGADMLGTVEFVSACYYRYALIDLEKLTENLQGDWDQARRVVSAFLTASALAIPSGKQNSFAAHNPPSLVAVTYTHEGIPMSLANAFEAPVNARQDSLTRSSITALEGHAKTLYGCYGAPTKAVAVSTEDTPKDTHLFERVGTLAELTTAIYEALDHSGEQP